MIAGMAGAGPELPSAARVLGGILVTLALAAGGIVAMKRVLAKTNGRWASPQGIRVAGKAILSSSLRAHLLEIDAARVLVVEGRNGIGLTVLPTPQEQPREAAK